jgi:hypothetical protein
MHLFTTSASGHLKTRCTLFKSHVITSILKLNPVSVSVSHVHVFDLCYIPKSPYPIPHFNQNCPTESSIYTHATVIASMYTQSLKDESKIPESIWWRQEMKQRTHSSPGLSIHNLQRGWILAPRNLAALARRALRNGLEDCLSEVAKRELFAVGATDDGAIGRAG